MTDPPRNHWVMRFALCFGAVALATSTAFLTWWTTTLSGLPDVGDPFDVAAFLRPIPDDSNAFVLYRQAVAILPKEPEIAAFDWKTADQEHRDWLDRSSQALEIWRKGTERPDALYINPGALTFDTNLNVVQNLRCLCRLASLQGGRLEESGDLAGALDWYLALLRSSRHCGQRGTFIERLIGIAMHRWASTHLKQWAADPRVDDTMIRRALDASIESDSKTALASDVLKAEYLSFLHSLEDPELMLKVHDSMVVANAKGGSITLYGQGGWRSSLTRVHRRLINDPERSRRVVRLVFANWLAYCDRPANQRPPKVSINPKIPSKAPAKALLDDLFEVDASAPESAKALPPEKVATWFSTTIDAKSHLPAFTAVETALARERAEQGSLLVTLANELFKREHGQFPENLEDLVGPYLKALPAGYLPPK